MSEKTLTPIEEVRGALTKMGNQFQMVLPPQIPLDRFIRVAMTAVQTKPSLLEANRQSLYAACMKAAQDGLLPDGKEAALVPFKGQVQYMPMVGGVLKKIRNSGELVSISAHVVYAADEFTFWVDDDGEHIKHVPFLEADAGDIRLVYAIAKTKDGGVYIEVMTLRQIEQVRSVSRAKDDGPWVTWWEQMAKKSALIRISKRLPMSTDAEEMIERDNENYDLAPTPQPNEKRPSRLESVVLPQMPAETIDMATGEILPAEKSAETAPPPNYEFLQTMAACKKEIGDESYYRILGVYKVKHSNEITDREIQKKVYAEMKQYAAATKEITS